MKAADKSGARWAIIIGDKELAEAHGADQAGTAGNEVHPPTRSVGAMLTGE